MSKRILILDDDPQLLEELKAGLAADYEVFTLQSSKTALDTAQRLRPDVLLMDVEMPGESGLQIASKIMYFSDLDDTQIIVMSGKQERYRAISELCGFKGFLLKPFCFAELKEKLEAADA